MNGTERVREEPFTLSLSMLLGYTVSKLLYHLKQFFDLVLGEDTIRSGGAFSVKRDSYNRRGSGAGGVAGVKLGRQ